MLLPQATRDTDHTHTHRHTNRKIVMGTLVGGCAKKADVSRGHREGLIITMLLEWHMPFDFNVQPLMGTRRVMVVRSGKAILEKEGTRHGSLAHILDTVDPRGRSCPATQKAISVSVHSAICRIGRNGSTPNDPVPCGSLPSCPYSIAQQFSRYISQIATESAAPSCV